MEIIFPSIKISIKKSIIYNLCSDLNLNFFDKELIWIGQKLGQRIIEFSWYYKEKIMTDLKWWYFQMKKKSNQNDVKFHSQIYTYVKCKKFQFFGVWQIADIFMTSPLHCLIAWTFDPANYVFCQLELGTNRISWNMRKKRRSN